MLCVREKILQIAKINASKKKSYVEKVNGFLHFSKASLILYIYFYVLFILYFLICLFDF